MRKGIFSILIILVASGLCCNVKGNEEANILKYYEQKNVVSYDKEEKYYKIILYESSFKKKDIEMINWENLCKIKKIGRINIHNNNIDDEFIIKYIAKLSEVEDLFLESNKITDASIEAIAGMKRIQDLRIYSSKVTDRGLKAIGTMKQLKKLLLDIHNITDKGIEYLESLNNLESLTIWGGNMKKYKIQDKDLESIIKLKALKELGLEDHEITDKGLEMISTLQELEVLRLGGDKVTDEGLVHLKGLKHLRELSLYGCPMITDKGLEHIAQIEGFMNPTWEACKEGQEDVECPQGLVNVACTGVTEKGWEWLFKTLNSRESVGERVISVNWECLPPQ